MNDTTGMKKEIISYAVIAFILFGILFGVQIMSFIFAQLTPTDFTTFTDTTFGVINETDGFLNSSGYTVAGASVFGFRGSVSIIEVFNATDDSLIQAGNYTVNALTGVITNASEAVYQDVLISYNYNRKNDAQLSQEGIQSNSLTGLQTYSRGANSQFNTVSIAIILILLIGVFLIFWKVLMGNVVGRSNSDERNFS